MSNSAESRLSDIAGDIRSVLHEKSEIRQRELSTNVSLALLFLECGEIHIPIEGVSNQFLIAIRNLIHCGEIVQSIGRDKIVFLWANESEFPHKRLFNGCGITGETIGERIKQKGW